MIQPCTPRHCKRSALSAHVSLRALRFPNVYPCGLAGRGTQGCIQLQTSGRTWSPHPEEQSAEVRMRTCRSTSTQGMHHPIFTQGPAHPLTFLATHSCENSVSAALLGGKSGCLTRPFRNKARVASMISANTAAPAGIIRQPSTPLSWPLHLLHRWAAMNAATADGKDKIAALLYLMKLWH